MNFEMAAEIKMSRPLTNADAVISPGSFTFVSGGKYYQFDFLCYEIEVLDTDSSIIRFWGSDLDFDTFPESEEITEDVLNNISEFSEFFIYSGELDEDYAEPLELCRCEFKIISTDSIITVPESVCTRANITDGF